MIEERIRLFQTLVANKHYKHFNLVLEELVQRVRYNRRWGRQHARDVAEFYL